MNISCKKICLCTYSNYLEAKIKFDYTIFDKVMRHDEILC